VSRYDAYFFDFDGVLADTEPVHFRVWREILLPAGIDLNWDYYARECIGVTDVAMLAKLGQLADPPKPARELIDLYPLKRKKFAAIAANESLITDNTARAVNALRNKKLAVVTSSRKSEVEPILLKAGILANLAACVYGDEIQNHKPLPEPYLKAVERTRAERALVFEDSASGLASARAAGLDVVHVTNAADLPSLIRDALSR